MRKSIVVNSFSEAIEDVKDGITITLGGFLTGNKPMALVREIVKKKIKNLTIIASPSSIDVDLLIGMGCVRNVMVPYVGCESLAPVGPFFRNAVEKKQINVIEMDEGIVLTSLRAVKQGVPSLPWKGGLGTSIPNLNEFVKEEKDTFTREPILMVKAIQPDVALIHATQSDPYGNIQHLGNSFADSLLAQASKKTIVQVERIVPVSEIKKHPELTTIPSIYVEKVVKAPFGAHPFFSQKNYLIDKKHICLYVDSVKAYLKGDKESFNSYLASYVYCDYEEYLQQISGSMLEIIE